MIKKIIRTLDNKLFSSFIAANNDDLSYYNEIVMKSEPLLNPFIPEDLAAELDFCNKWPLRQLHYQHKGTCILEPDLGWAVTKKWEVLPFSNFNLYIHKFPPPLYSKYLLKKTTVKLDKVISLKYAWNNYGHFMNDLLGQLHLAEQLGVTDAQLVVPEGLARKTYFSDFLKLSAKMRAKNWFFQQDGMYVSSDNAHFFNTWFSHRYNFDATLDLFDADVLSRNDHNGTNRIFVGRKKHRVISNMGAVMPVLERYGFRYVELEQMPLEEQIRLFTNASHVMGIHGAALTNIIFRRGKSLKFFELYAAAHLDPFYYWICVHYGFDYGAMVCGPGEGETSDGGNSQNALPHLHDLHVDVRMLERMINEFMGL